MRLLYKICVNQDSFDKTGLLQICLTRDETDYPF